MNNKNRTAKLVGYFHIIPQPLRSKVMSFLLGLNIPFFGTTGVFVHELSQGKAVMSVKNRRRVQNHIKGVHACAMSVLAESATGMLIGMNVPDDKLPLIKTMNIDYRKRAQGDLKAVAQLTTEQIGHIRATDKGELTVPVTLSDAAGNEPATFEMTWAWIPKRS